MNAAPGRPRAALLLALTVAVTIVAQAGAGGATAALGAQDVQSDSVSMRIAIDTDGTARWELRYHVRLDDANSTAAFESLSDDVRTNPDDYRRRFVDRIGGAVARAENDTGREMTVWNVSVHAHKQEFPQPAVGIITYSFEWAGFAVVDGTQVRAGDAIAGFFIDERTTLEVAWPDDYRTDAVSPAPDERYPTAVTWNGPKDFASDEPRVILVPDNASSGGTVTGPSDDDPLFGDSLAAIATAVGAVGAVALGTRWWLGRRRHPGPAAGPDEPPPELLSNEERVKNVLESAGGRLKQQEIGARLEWTDPKTSKVVQKLREEGSIEVFRLGRENVVSLPADEEDDDA